MYIATLSRRLILLISTTMLLSSTGTMAAQWEASLPWGTKRFYSENPLSACDEMRAWEWGYSVVKTELLYGYPWSTFGDPNTTGKKSIHCALVVDENPNCAVGISRDSDPLTPFRCQDFVLLRLVAEGENNAGDPSCRTSNGSNPVHTATGNKYQIELDFSGVRKGTLKVERHYNSKFSLNGSFGTNWRSRYDRALLEDAAGFVQLLREDGKVIQLHYNSASGAYEFAAPGIMFFAKREVAGGWTVKLADNHRETYDEDGRVTKIEHDGDFENIHYKVANDPVSAVSGISKIDYVENTFGDLLIFEYSDNGYISEIAAPGGLTIRYTYEKDNINKVEYFKNGDVISSREYLYEDARFAGALTGLIDERGERSATWGYDDLGRAVSSEHGAGKDRYVFTFNDDDSTVVEDPHGHNRTYRFSTRNGVIQYDTISGGDCSQCSGDAASYTYDANGYVETKTDFNGNVTRYLHDAFGRELSRTEAEGTPEERTITFAWDTTINKPLEITEPGRITTFTYDTHGRLESRVVQSQP